MVNTPPTATVKFYQWGGELFSAKAARTPVYRLREAVRERERDIQ